MALLWCTRGFSPDAVRVPWPTSTGLEARRHGGIADPPRNAFPQNSRLPCVPCIPWLPNPQSSCHDGVGAYVFGLLSARLQPPNGDHALTVSRASPQRGRHRDRQLRAAQAGPLGAPDAQEGPHPLGRGHVCAPQGLDLWPALFAPSVLVGWPESTRTRLSREAEPQCASPTLRTQVLLARDLGAAPLWAGVSHRASCLSAVWPARTNPPATAISSPLRKRSPASS